VQKKDGELDAPAQELAHAVRRSTSLITGLLAGIVVIAVIVVVVLPNVVALPGEVR
jgi:hypothetical protein